MFLFVLFILLTSSSGWGNGFNTATTPLWVAELIPARTRGLHVSIEGNLIAFGVVIAYYLKIFLHFGRSAMEIPDRVSRDIHHSPNRLNIPAFRVT